MKKKQARVMPESRNGHPVWLPADKVGAWKQGQEALKRGDPEAIRQKERLASALEQRLRAL